jgi:hypothetical protein
MSITKKKVTPKAVEPKYRYAIDQKVFTIVNHKGRPEELLEVKILARSKREIALRDMAGKRVGTDTIFSYYVIKPDGFTGDLWEVQLYPNYVEAAKAFAKGFLFLLK